MSSTNGGDPQTVGQLLEAPRGRLERLDPEAAHQALLCETATTGSAYSPSPYSRILAYRSRR